MLDQQAVNNVFSALGDPTRRAIVERLSAGPASVSELAKPLDLTLAAVLQHVQVLEGTCLVSSEKVGRTRICRLEERGLNLASQWLAERKALWERRYDRLGELLDEPGASENKEGNS
jgi:DNA-binding transcriptional ArsR family regulator